MIIKPELIDQLKKRIMALLDTAYEANRFDYGAILELALEQAAREIHMVENEVRLAREEK